MCWIVAALTLLLFVEAERCALGRTAGANHRTVNDQLQFSLGADNVFDEQPPGLPDTRIGGAGSFAGAEIFPVVGRYWYLGARVTF